MRARRPPPVRRAACRAWLSSSRWPPRPPWGRPVREPRANSRRAGVGRAMRPWSYDRRRGASVELTEADLPGEHALGVGDELVARLDENRTTGYRWRADDLPAGVTLVDDGFEAP